MTTVDPDGPCDTRMMGVVHSALRRDLVRSRMLLADSAALTEGRRVALADHIVWLMNFLHDHHCHEDAGLYPMTLRNDPSTAALIADMGADHERIDPAMAAVVSAATTYSRDAGTSGALVDALVGLDSVLIPHLTREETVMMPVVSACVSQRELKAWDDQMNVGSKPMLQLAMEGHWLLDNLDDAGRDAVLAMVPPVPRFVLLHLLGRRYRKLRRLLWQDDAAVGVPSLSLALYSEYLG